MKAVHTLDVILNNLILKIAAKKYASIRRFLDKVLKMY